MIFGEHHDNLVPRKGKAKLYVENISIFRNYYKYNLISKSKISVLFNISFAIENI
jgi:hypothetical protein